RTGSSPSKMCRNENCGAWRPKTTTQSVSGVDSMSPAGPHSTVQSTVVSISANEEIPVWVPYSHGSIKLPVTSSSVANNRNTNNGGFQLSNTASESSRGSKAATSDPT